MNVPVISDGETATVGVRPVSDSVSVAVASPENVMRLERVSVTVIVGLSDSSSVKVNADGVAVGDALASPVLDNVRLRLDVLLPDGAGRDAV